MPIVVLALALMGAGCGSSSDSSSESTSSGPVATPSADPAVEKLVPAAIKSKGALSVATDPSYPPNEFYDTDNKTIIGLDPDLADAITAVMGLEAEMKAATFDGLIPGLAAGKYDIGMASFTDTKEREEVVDFVTYFSAGTAFFTRSDGPDVGSLAELCGHSVAVEKGTATEEYARDQAAKCRTSGEPAVEVQVFPGQDSANLALSSGRAEVSMADSPVADYQVELSNGAFKLVGDVFGAAPYGVAVPKDSGLAKPILAALEVLIEDGTYAEILAKWGVTSGAIDSPEINGAIE